MRDTEVVSLAGIKIVNAGNFCRACAEGNKVPVQLELMTVILETGWLKEEDRGIYLPGGKRQRMKYKKVRI